MLEARVVRLRHLGLARPERGASRLPCGAKGRAPSACLAVVREDVVRHLEVLVGIEVEDLLDRSNLVFAERAAMSMRGVGVLR